MFIGKRTGKGYLSVAYTIIIIFLLITCNACDSSVTSQLSSRATAQAETDLTKAYGTEVSRIIENFESKWLSLDAHKNSSIQSDLAVDPWLDYFGNAREGAAIYDEPFWLITETASVNNVRVLEYDPKRFKAIARVVMLVDKMTPQGKVMDSGPTLPQCNVYVFVRGHDNDPWKLASAFNMTDMDHVERDWNSAAEWQKQLIGTLPEGGCN